MSMKIIFLAIAMCFYVLPVYAYIDNTRADETQMTAGDQNSAKHRLSDKNLEALKKLKRADEYVTRVRAVGKTVNAENLESLLLSDKEDRQRQDMKQMLLDLEMKARTPRMLVVQTDHSIYTNLYTMRSNQVKDAQMSRELWRQLRNEKR